MNPKGFPKRLDSKTSCLRITVPENLDLALEGLIRKVLREQPKTDDVYAFAADYFENLLKIRDKAGAKFTASQLCPFHNEEEAHEMIILAGRFSKRAGDDRPRKEEKSSPKKIKSLGSKKKIDKAVPESGIKRYTRASFRDRKPDKEEKLTTPDLIKKLPVSDVHRAGDSEKEMVKEGSQEEEFLTSDPIKELVEKEFLTSANSSKNSETENKGPLALERESTEPRAGEGDFEERAKLSGEIVGIPTPLPAAGEATENCVMAVGEEAPGSTEVTGGLKIADGMKENKIDEGMSKVPGTIAEGSEDGTVDVAKRESEDRRSLNEMQLKEGKGNHEETDGFQLDKEPKEIESKATKETLDATLPNERSEADEKNSETTDKEMTEDDKTETDNDANPRGHETSPELSFPHEQGIEAPERKSPPSEAENAIHPPSKPVPSRAAGTEEKKPNELAAEVENAKEDETGQAFFSASDSHEAGGDEKDDAQEDDTVKGQTPKTEEKKANELAAESTTQDVGTGRDPAERQEDKSENAVLPEGSKAVQEIAESGERILEQETLRERGKEDSDGKEENCDAKPEKQNTLPAKEEEKLTSPGASEAKENATEVHQSLESVAAATDSASESRKINTTEPSKKQDRDDEGNGVNEQLIEVKYFDEAAEPQQNKEKGKANEEVDVKNQNATENRAEHSPTIMEAPTEKGEVAQEDKPTTGSGSQSPIEECKRESQENLKQEASADSETSPKNSTGGEAPEAEVVRPRDEGDGHEAVPTADNEAPSQPEQELCSVVDVLNVPKQVTLAGERSENLEQAESLPYEVSETEPEQSPECLGTQSTPSENSNNFNLDLESETKINREKVHESESGEQPDGTPSDRALITSENDQKADFKERLAPDSHEPGTSPGTSVQEGKQGSELEESNPSASGKHIVIIEEPERVHETANASAPGGEIQIKTIQTHYYDSLRVPEILTREYRVHGVPDLSSASLFGENALPTPSKTTTANGDGVPSSTETAEAPGLEELADRGTLVSADDRRDGPLDEKAPDPDDVTKSSDSSLQTTCGKFLTNERLFSSLESEEIRYVAPEIDEPEVVKSTENEREIDGSVREKASTETEEVPPATPSETEKPMRPTGEEASPNREKAESPTQTAEVLPDLIDGRTAEGEPATTFGGSSGLRGNATNNGDEEDAGRAKEEPLPEKTKETDSRERTAAAGEFSSAETDSTASSAATEIKRSDSAGGNFASATRPPSRSLDSRERNPLMRTRSLSTHRRGIADFDVWNTIEKELEEAATKIQSKYRGYKTRKKLQRENAVQITTEESSRRTTPAESEDENDHRRSTGEFHDVIVLSDHPR